MYIRLKNSLWRTVLILLLFTLIFVPASGLTARAAPSGQEPEPQAVDASGDHLVTNLVLGPDTPNILPASSDPGDSQRVNVTFDYSTTEASGVRIFVRPFTDGAPSPGYVAHGSPLYPTSATGTGSGWFAISSGTVVVDEIRIQMLNADQTVLLFESFIPVYYLFSDQASLVTHLSFTPDTPDALALDQNVDVTFNYRHLQRLGVQIFIRPYTNGSPTPNYAAHPSPSYPAGSGGGTGFFTVTHGQKVVDQVHVTMVVGDQQTLLFEAFLPVYFRFRNPNHIVTHIELSPDTPNIFKYSQDVNLTFNYSTNEPGGVRIWARPFSGSNLSPGYAAHGSPLYPTGSGSGTGSFRLTNGPRVVDKIRIQMWDANQTKLLHETFLPVHLFWAGSGPPPGPDMKIDAVEVTQAIQDLNNSVDLVAGKRTYVRVHVSSPVNVSSVYATLSARRWIFPLFPVLSPGNPGSTITIKSLPSRSQINDSFWFELPANWTSAGSLRLTARLDPNNAKNDLAQGNNIRSVTVNFQNTPPLRLRLFNVQYTVGSNTYLAANNHLNALESWLRRAYPINSLQVTRQTFVYPGSGLPNVDTLNGWLVLGKIIRMIFSGEDGRTVYYGMVDDGGGFMRGKAAGIPGSIASGPTGPGDWGWDFDGSYGDWYGGHEIGHTRGRYHAEFCGATGGAAYPYPNGRISNDLTGNAAIFGFDTQTRSIYAPDWTDVMTYCDNEWVSDFTYEGIRSYLVGQGFNSPETASPEPEMATASQFLAVMGMADLETNTASLESVYLINQENTLPLPEEGKWQIVLLNASKQVLATYFFEPDELTDSEESEGIPALIGEVVPWVAGATTVEIRSPEGQPLDARSASANPPSVVLDSPAENSQLQDGPFSVSWTGSDPDGDALTYSLFYSNDGQDWDPLATGLSVTKLELDSQQLPGGTGMLRVVVSDGFLSGQDTNAGLTVPLHAPTAQIVSPAPNASFYSAQQVVLQGAAYDTEDGTLGDEAFSWSSSIDGELGTGASLSTGELTSGVHTITLTVTDSQGMSASAQLNISVGSPGTTIFLPVIQTR